MLHHGIQILIQHAFQTSPIAARAISAPGPENPEEAKNNPMLHGGIVSLNRYQEVFRSKSTLS
jgi:hypothetical protein